MLFENGLTLYKFFSTMGCFYINKTISKKSSIQLALKKRDISKTPNINTLVL